MNARPAPAALALLLAACGGHSTASVPPTDPRTTIALLSTLADDSLEGRRTGQRGSIRAAEVIAREMQRLGLDTAGDSGYFQRVPVPSAPLPGFNVLGLIPGSDPALRYEYVIVDAHYDHLGIGPPVNGDSIYNGADDDASGVVAVLSIAAAMSAGPRPKRSVVFAAMTGEEVGLIGTRYFIGHPTIPIGQVVANLEIEMIGRPDSLAGGVGKAWLTGYARSTMGAALAKDGIPIVADPRPGEHFFERSDNIAFAWRGIVAHTLSSFSLHADYHRPSDDVSRINGVHMARVIDAAIAAVRILADGPKPEWVPGGKPELPAARKP